MTKLELSKLIIDYGDFRVKANTLDELRDYETELVDRLYEAINYSQCCMGEAEQLPIARCGCEEPDPTEIKVCMQCDGYVEQAIAYNISQIWQVA